MNFLCLNISCPLFISFSTYLFVLPGGEVHTHDRADAGGPPTCVNYRHAWGREDLPSTGKTMGKREKSLIDS